MLDHPAKKILEKPFVHYVANVPSKANDHFFGLREAKSDLVGVAIFDSIPQELDESGPLCALKWRCREIENYLCFPQTLLAYAQHVEGEAGPTFEPAPRERQMVAMQQSMDEVAGALRTLGRPEPFGPNAKASEEFLDPVFQSYFSKLGLRNLMQKTDYHVLAHLVPRERIDSEISEKLDRIVKVAKKAKLVI